MADFIDKDWAFIQSQGFITKGQLWDKLEEPTGEILKEHAVNSIDHSALYETSPMRVFPLYDNNQTQKISWNKDLLNADNICAAIWKLNYDAKHEYIVLEEEEDYRIKRSSLHLLQMEGRVNLIGWREKGTSLNKLYEYHSVHFQFTFRFHVPSNETEIKKLSLRPVTGKFSAGDPNNVFSYSKEEAKTLLRDFELNYPTKYDSM